MSTTDEIVDTSSPLFSFENGSRPRSPHLHLFPAREDPFLLQVETGRIFPLQGQVARNIDLALNMGDGQRANLMAMMAGIRPRPLPAMEIPTSVPVRSFSLAVAQKCNLGCTYCYAEQGSFGGRPSNMPLDVAKASVDRLLEDAAPGEKIVIGFMGGEPLFNRSVLHDTTKYAFEKASQRQVEVDFTMTTNATLIRPEDIDLFQKYGITLTVSIDGLGGTNDTLRPFISGKGSFQRVTEKVKQVLSLPNRTFQVNARVTVTPKNLNLPEIMVGLLDLGFDSVQFSPMLKSPTGKEQMSREDFDTLLEQLIACGELFREGLNQRKLYPLKNVISTLKRIHDYQREAYPCGAGGGYMGVSAEGDLYACHRFVNDAEGKMGDLEKGVDPAKQEQWLKERNLAAQNPCTSCWARYMCSGSCHHEVIYRGRPACDYIRGWLHYCLGLYVQLMKEQPRVLSRMLGDNPTAPTSNKEDDGTGIQY